MKRALSLPVALLAFCLVSVPVRSQEQGAGADSSKAGAALKIVDAKLGTDVQDREIVGEATQFPLNQKVYLWLKVTGGPAEDITVTWKQGEKSYETKLKIGGSPWRTWAYKTGAIAGPWTVTVTDAAGNVLKEMDFTVGEASTK